MSVFFCVNRCDGKTQSIFACPHSDYTEVKVFLNHHITFQGGQRKIVKFGNVARLLIVYYVCAPH